MLFDIALLLLLTFGLSRLASFAAPNSWRPQIKIAVANFGSWGIISLFYLIVFTDAWPVSAVAIPVAAACQALWAWRDWSNLPAPLGSETKVPIPKLKKLLVHLTEPLAETEKENMSERYTPPERWNALVRFDSEIRGAAEKLQSFGQFWVDELGKAFFALEEDRKYLPEIVRRLTEEARQAEQKRWADTFRYTADGSLCTEHSLNILRKAQDRGYRVGVEKDKSIIVEKDGVMSYLWSNGDIQRFGQFAELGAVKEGAVAGDTFKNSKAEPGMSFRKPMYFPQGATLFSTKGPMVAILSDGTILVDHGGIGGRRFKTAAEYRATIDDRDPWTLIQKF